MNDENKCYTRVVLFYEDGEDDVVLQYFCYLTSPYNKDELIQHEIMNIYSNGNCDYHKIWGGNDKTLESNCPINEIEWYDEKIGYAEKCSLEEFNGIKSVILRLCEVNSMYCDPEAHKVDPWS